jgi:phosphinothricin acetyltransferase
MSTVMEPLRDADWDAVRVIYQEGIVTDQATFEEQAPSWEAWDGSHLATCRLVARHDGTIVGWSALSRASDRCIYRGVAETSVYVSASARGQGVGTALLSATIVASEAAGLWTLQAGIFPENAASLTLHKACGFREVGRRERIGKMGRVWRDTVLLERRSAMVGV